MAISTIKRIEDYSNLNALSYYNGFHTADGHYYTATIKYLTMSKGRFSMIIQRTSQAMAFSPIGVSVNVHNNVLHDIIFSDTSCTFDKSTMTITIDGLANSWANPIIIYPKGFIEFE